MVMADGTNLTVSLGKDGILLVDTGSPKMTDKILAAVTQLASAGRGAGNECVLRRQLSWEMGMVQSL